MSAPGYKDRHRTPFTPLALVLALALAATATLAQDHHGEFAAAATVSVEALVQDPLPRRFCLSEAGAPPLLSGVDDAVAKVSPASWTLSERMAWNMDHRDGGFDQLLRTRRLQLLTLMQTDSTRLFFGINAKGRIGVHWDGTSLLAPR